MSVNAEKAKMRGLLLEDVEVGKDGESCGQCRFKEPLKCPFYEDQHRKEGHFWFGETDLRFSDCIRSEKSMKKLHMFERERSYLLELTARMRDHSEVWPEYEGPCCCRECVSNSQ